MANGMATLALQPCASPPRGSKANAQHLALARK